MITRVSRLGKQEEGFTLIELLVVVAIIALLTAFAVPKLFDAINKSKDARGQGDMETIPGAFDRFYFDSNGFPTGTVTEIKGAVMPAYLKNTTKYVNGYGRGYIYITNATGDYYIVVDPKSLAEASTVTVSCEDGNTPANTGTATATVGHDLTLANAGSTLTSAMVSHSCSAADADANPLPFVTN